MWKWLDRLVCMIWGTRKPRWVPVYVCKKCKEELSEKEWAYSNGVCPYCGNVTDGTFVDADKTSKLK